MNEASISSSYSRRDFLKTTGSMTIGFCLWDACSSDLPENQHADELPRSISCHPIINAWIEILENGRICVLTGKMELGQGIRIAVAQVAAEELNADINMVEVNLAQTGRTPDEGHTAGSRSIEGSAMAIRHAAAAAREKLLELASQQLSIEKDKLSLENGVILDAKSSTKLTLFDLLQGRQLEDEVQLPLKLKSKAAYKYVGHPVPRKDIEMMARGIQVHVHDLRFPGMVHARIVRPPHYEAGLQNYDDSAITSMDGILQVINDGSFLAVIAQDEYQAVRAAEALKKKCTWTTSSNFPTDFDAKSIKELPSDEHSVKSSGNNTDIPNSKNTVSAQYSKPYLMHGSVGPSCAVALFDQGQLTIWSHTQGVYPLREAIRKLLGMEEENIQIIGVPGAGCYGHNGADDVAAEAAILAINYPGKHIRLQWSRQEEHSWEPYGSAMVMELSATLGKSGKIHQWNYDIWSDAHSSRPGGDPSRLLPARYLQNPLPPPGARGRGGAYRNSEPYYKIPNLNVNAHFFKGPLRVSALRSLGAYANIFAIESFMDELAHKAGTEALTFRLKHTTDLRAKAVMERIAKVTRNEKTSVNEGIGFAFSRYKNSASYFAAAVKLQVDVDTKQIKLKKMWGVIDSGEVINPDGLKNQTEGGMIQSASWTLMEKVTFSEDQLSDTDWGSYPILRFDNIPEVEVEIIDRPMEQPLGAGEAAHGPTSAAIANAIFSGTGQRIRQLPISASFI